MNLSMTKFGSYLKNLQDFAELSSLKHLNQHLNKETISSASSLSSVYTASGGPIEKGAILLTTMEGPRLPLAATQSDSRESLAGHPYCVCGISIILHPRHPLAPIIHGNIRMFCVETRQGSRIWYGGGVDLTPCSPDESVAQNWHDGLCQRILKLRSADIYQTWREQCDSYFYLRHRSEPRGIGGVFFDELSLGVDEDESHLHFSLSQIIEYLFDFYFPLIASFESDVPFDENDSEFQSYRRGRYVEFNLLYDRGTLFGLQSGGRTDSILLSMPPRVSWPGGLKKELQYKNENLVKFLLETRSYKPAPLRTSKDILSFA